VTLGEGYTPLVETPTWAAEFKLEYVFPSGSFKDRGATTTLSRASELGVSEIVEDSSGNAGAAIAMYAARADVDAEIFVPATAKEAKLRAIESAGATTNRVAGTREEVTEACIEAVETGDIWYASHAWNPAFFAGTKTFALEVAAQRDWTAPDAVVIGVGHGTLFLGAYRGFKSLYKAGWIDRMPQMLAAQADGYAPIVESVRGDYRAESTNELADGIQIADPPRGHQIVDAIEATGGDAIALTDAEVKETLTRLHREGFYTEPTCAVAPAAIKKYRSAGVLDESEDVVVPLTGSGLKS
jgi:threonine synthase